MVVVGEAYADMVMYGKITYKRALYSLFYKWNFQNALDYYDRMNECIFINNRADLIIESERARKVIYLALTNRAKYFEEHGDKEEAEKIIYERDHAGSLTAI